MKLSTRTRYGTKALLDIAQHSDRGLVRLQDIAKRLEISEDYLEHILISLKVAGLIRSIRGARGGFVMAKPPSEIRLDEVIQVLEGKIALVECIGDPEVCSRADVCVTHILWQEVTSAMTQVLKSTTLQDLVERQEKEK
mgnify:CR=1 FL=1